MEGGRQRINGEVITGIALVTLASLFMWAATMNPIWATILIADYFILAIGIGFIILGAITIIRSNRGESHSQRASRY
jgi:putative Ca2+/H+ antiporter (TMEM165/GDT1 family)